jgi:hypothetical protein
LKDSFSVLNGTFLKIIRYTKPNNIETKLGYFLKIMRNAKIKIMGDKFFRMSNAVYKSVRFFCFFPFLIKGTMKIIPEKNIPTEIGH